MKKIVLIITMFCIALGANAQSCYWVFLTDKAGTAFDPYSYFDSKAIERYKLNNANLYDISNYPLNESYTDGVNAIATEEVGESRWFNAVAVMATDEQIARIEQLPNVKEVKLIASEMQIAEYARAAKSADNHVAEKPDMSKLTVTDQLLRMQGNLFIENGIDASGVRIAVFDGGFHAVNTHDAFKHLRDNGRIIATWDFTKKRENVYDNHTHGTMVLSCIAGKLGDKQLGLATGATFLLAKTEVDPEPFKEEVWWAQAMEWADKNGADVVNSSLGYGKDRHYTYEMDGRSYVAKAANMAARKGMLVCNSAGNEGDDNGWKCIITPSDADSVLCVGGISASLTSYSHISFSSYGPSADGRLKPNVCNFGYCEVADPHNDKETDFAYGTSFSSPLTAGFCACAWQTMRDKTAMEMKSMIEQSADLYPYYDYAFGYGVPQASFFLEESKRIIEPAATFAFEDRGKLILIHPYRKTAVSKGMRLNLESADLHASMSEKEDVVMLKIQDSKGLVKKYVNLGIENLNDEMYIAIPKASICGYTLVAHVNGFTNKYTLSKIDSIYYSDETEDFDYYVVDTAGYYVNNYEEHGNRDLDNNKVDNWAVGQKYLAEGFIQYGMQWPLDGNFEPSHVKMRYSDAWNIGVRFMRNFKKWYSLGVGIEMAYPVFRYKNSVASVWDNSLLITDFANVTKKRLQMYNYNLELFQRIRIVPGGSLKNKGLHWDLGVYGGLQYSEYSVDYNKNENPACREQVNSYQNLTLLKKYNWGLATRLAWDCIGLYGRYRMSQPDLDLPRLELGLQLTF